MMARSRSACQPVPRIELPSSDSPFTRGALNGRPSLLGPAQPACHTPLSQLHPVSTMSSTPQQQKRREVTLSSLNAAIEAMTILKEATSITPAPAVFGTVSILLTIIRVCFSPLQRFIPGSHRTRTRWPTKPTMSSSEWPALTCVGLLTGGRTEGNWMNSVGPRTMRLSN